VRGVDGHRRRGGCGPRCSRRGEQGADIRGENRPISHIPPYWPVEAPTIASGSAAIAFCTGGARQPVDRILESAGSAAVVLRCHQQDRVGFSDGRRAAC